MESKEGTQIEKEVPAQSILRNRRGFVQIEQALSAMMLLMVMGGVVIAVAAFQATQDNTSISWQILNNTLGFALNLTSQLTTAGTVGGVAILIGFLVGGFGLVGLGGMYLYGKMQRGRE